MVDEKNKIVVIDDNPDNTFLIRKLIESSEIEVFTAETGIDGLNIITSESIDLVLLDIMLPEMDGYQICKIVKDNPKTAHIPIIFLSAKFTKDDIIYGFRAGAVDYITKPFNREELIVRIQTHLDLKKSRDLINNQKIIFEKQNLQLIELNATKDKFFSIIAHDLKNPFNTILGYSRLLSKRYNTLTEDKRKEFIREIYDSSECVFNLLENLLEWSKTQTGRINYSPRKINLSDIVRGVVLLTQTNAGKKQIMLENNVASGVSVYADEDMVTFVIRNLVSNALKFTPSGGRISIYADVADCVYLTVKDSGVGIKDVVLSNLFKLDANISTKGTDNESGTGLGLILSKEFIERNNGTISAISEVGLGSSFIISLPLATANT